MLYIVKMSATFFNRLTLLDKQYIQVSDIKKLLRNSKFIFLKTRYSVAVLVHAGFVCNML